jgi:Holliday junction resolvasome RuvABC ATP-dependent DNA helicase subunit
MLDTIMAAREKVDGAFRGFIGNADAVYAIKRSLIYAISNTKPGELPNLSKVFLLSGPPSVGKTEIARRITACLGVPFVRVDGRAVRSRDKLFEMIDDALAANTPPMGAKPGGSRSGMAIWDYPAFAVFIDEVHLIAEKTQEAFLTLLEADDRTMQLDGERGRRIANVKHAAWIFATTKPANLDRAFRSRCADIQLARYSVEEVQLMVRNRFQRLPDYVTETVATASRLVPRQAFTLAQEVEEEIFMDPTGDVKACTKRVLNGHGIRFTNGATVDDVRYLEVLMRNNRQAVGERVLEAELCDIDPLRISEDIEPFLLMKRYINIGPKGRMITAAGDTFCRDARDVLKSEAKK